MRMVCTGEHRSGEDGGKSRAVASGSESPGLTRSIARRGYALGAALIVLGLLIAAAGTSETASGMGGEKMVEIRGIYGSPNVFWEKGLRLDELGINGVFIYGPAVTEEMIERAREEGAKVYAEFATLNGSNYVEEHPEAWAIDQNGEKVKPATWFMGVCPTEPGFRRYRMKKLRELLQKFDVGGVWMDYLHWHAQFEDPEPILPETCFCDHCLTTFQAASGVELPEGSTAAKAEWIIRNHDSTWRDWRCSVVAGWARDMKMIVKQVKPSALLGAYNCPWDDDEFDGARRRILGLDYDMLRESVDAFSPMVYHGRMGRTAGWVKENIEWFCRRLNIEAGTFPKVWPIVQCHDEPQVVSPQAFEDVLRYGVSAGATGVMMFTSNSVAEDDAKTETMKRVYLEWRGKQ